MILWYPYAFLYLQYFGSQAKLLGSGGPYLVLFQWFFNFRPPSYDATGSICKQSSQLREGNVSSMFNILLLCMILNVSGTPGLVSRLNEV